MHCTVCCWEVNEQAILCVRCGSHPRTGRSFCGYCGFGVRPQAMACLGCGRALPEPRVAQIPGPVASPRLQSPTHALGANPLTWPFGQPEWQQSLWMPFCWWFNPVLPLGLMLRKGWAIEAARRMREGRSPLPEPSEMGKLLVNGTIIMLAEFFYFVLPLGLLALASNGRFVVDLWELVVLLWKFFWQKQHEPLWSYLARGLFALMADSAAPAAILAVATPMWAAAKVRFVVTGSASSFVNLFASVGLIFRHFGGLLRYLFFSLLADSVSAAIIGASTITGPLATLVVIAIPAAKCWVSSRFLGEFAKEVKPI